MDSLRWPIEGIDNIIAAFSMKMALTLNTQQMLIYNYAKRQKLLWLENYYVSSKNIIIH